MLVGLLSQGAVKEGEWSMPRHVRVVLPCLPHHIIQRGHNRKVVCVHDDDYAYYLENLQAWKAHYGVKVYAFCLMTNHVHLLLNGEKMGTDLFF